jgi:DNA-binding CsgD family transcriptional regulator
MRERIESLSPRQLEVMRGVARRLSSKEIAFHLGLSPATVDSHIAAALQRLQLTSRRDAALHLIELGYSSGQLTVSALPFHIEHDDGHHGGYRPPQSPPFASGWRARIPFLRRRGSGYMSGGRGGAGKGEGDGSEPPVRRSMAKVMVRYLLDALYVSFFFAIMSAVAYGASRVVIQCEQSDIDPVILWILRGVSYTLAAIDGVGVVTATSFLTFRFVRAIWKADD